MPNTYLTNPLVFIVHTLFSLYILCIMLRFLLQWVRADFYNPVTQFLVKATNPLLKPLRRFIPGYGGLDTSAIVLMVILQLISLTLVGLLRGQSFGLPLILIYSLAELVELALNVFIFSIFIQVILSWISPGTYNPITSLLHSLTEPLLGPARRMIPPISGMDLSPLVVLLILQVVKMLAIPPIQMLTKLVT